MSTVTFPGLGLSFHLNRVAFSVGNFHVYWYGIIIACGFAMAALFCCCQSKRFGIRADDFMDVVLIGGPSGVVGARLYYIIFNNSLYRGADGHLDIKACLNVHNGGLAIYGGIIVGVLAAFLVARYKKLSFPAVADLCGFGFLIGQMVGRWGNFVNAEAYGRETTLPWRMGIEKTVDGVTKYMEVHPTFLYESLWNLLGFCLLLLVLYRRWRKFDGMIFLLYVAWYGLGRGCIESLRTDSLYVFSTGIRTSQLVGLLSCAVAVILLIWNLKRHPTPEQLFVNQSNTRNQKNDQQANRKENI